MMVSGDLLLRESQFENGEVNTASAVAAVMKSARMGRTAFDPGLGLSVIFIVSYG